MDRAHAVEQLRVLAALERELNLLVARRVSDARKGDVSWDDIAAAVGVGTPTAWRRWKDIIDDPRPTGQARRSSKPLVLDDRTVGLVKSLTKELAQQTLSPASEQAWASAVREAAGASEAEVRGDPAERAGD